MHTYIYIYIYITYICTLIFAARGRLDLHAARSVCGGACRYRFHIHIYIYTLLLYIYSLLCLLCIHAMLYNGCYNLLLLCFFVFVFRFLRTPVSRPWHHPLLCIYCHRVAHVMLHVRPLENGACREQRDEAHAEEYDLDRTCSNVNTRPSKDGSKRASQVQHNNYSYESRGAIMRCGSKVFAPCSSRAVIIIVSHI